MKHGTFDWDYAQNLARRLASREGRRHKVTIGKYDNDPRIPVYWVEEI